MINVINNTCDFPTTTRQKVCCEKGVFPLFCAAFTQRQQNRKNDKMRRVQHSYQHYYSPDNTVFAVVLVVVPCICHS